MKIFQVAHPISECQICTVKDTNVGMSKPPCLPKGIGSFTASVEKCSIISKERDWLIARKNVPRK